VGKCISKKCVLVLVYPGSYCAFELPWSRTWSSYRSLDHSWTAESLVDCQIVRGLLQNSWTFGLPLDSWACHAIIHGSVPPWITCCAWSFTSQFLTLWLILFICSPIHSFATPFIPPFLNSFLRSYIHSFVYQLIRLFINSFLRSSLISFTSLSFQLSHWGIRLLTCLFTWLFFYLP